MFINTSEELRPSEYNNLSEKHLLETCSPPEGAAM